MRTFITTVGWTEWHIASALLKHGLSKGDKIILFSPEKRDERSREAINEVKSFVSKFAPGVDVSDVSVPVHNPVEAIVFLAKKIGSEAGDGRRLIVNLSGGMRILVIEVLLALTLLEVKNLELEIRTEDKVDLSIPKIWRKQPTPSREEITVLRVLSESRDVSLSDMAKRLRVSPATMHRILRRMEEEEFIETKKIGREKIAELTLKGEVFSKLFLEKKEPGRE